MEYIDGEFLDEGSSYYERVPLSAKRLLVRSEVEISSAGFWGFSALTSLTTRIAGLSYGKIATPSLRVYLAEIVLCKSSTGISNFAELDGRTTRLEVEDIIYKQLCATLLEAVE